MAQTGPLLAKPVHFYGPQRCLCGFPKQKRKMPAVRWTRSIWAVLLFWAGLLSSLSGKGLLQCRRCLILFPLRFVLDRSLVSDTAQKKGEQKYQRQQKCYSGRNQQQHSRASKVSKQYYATVASAPALPGKEKRSVHFGEGILAACQKGVQHPPCFRRNSKTANVFVKRNCMQSATPSQLHLDHHFLPAFSFVCYQELFSSKKKTKKERSCHA
jgi:hypothetical protein